MQVLGEIACDAGDHAEAISLYGQSLAISRELDDRFGAAAALSKLAETHRLLGQPEEAIDCARQSLALSREIGDQYWAASSLANTGVIAFYTGNYVEAGGYLKEANALYREMGYREGIAGTNVVLSTLALFFGLEPEQKEALAKEALEIAGDIGHRRVAQSARYLPEFMARSLEKERDEQRDEQRAVPRADVPTAVGRYIVKRRRNVGGQTSVYLADDPENGREVAVKEMHPGFLEAYAPQVIQREAEIMASLAHPAIPECYAYNASEKPPYIVMAFIDGQDLSEMIGEQEQFLPEGDAIGWVTQLCDVFGYMHSQRPAPFIYRDMKPSNAMVGRDGTVYLVDFGITVANQPGRESTMIGTAGYASPEQYVAYSDARSDVYALGATLHHLLTRRDPRKEKPFSFHDAPPRSLNPAISEALEAVILKATEHHPLDRYQSVEEMKAALLACL